MYRPKPYARRRLNTFTSEANLHQMVCDYLRLQYSDVIFRTDYSAGIKLTMGQAAKHKRLQSSRAYPDLFVAEPRGKYHGLYIELKREGTIVYLKSGALSSVEHIQEQGAMLVRLRMKGYKAEFAVGFEEAKKLIDDYMCMI